MKRILIDNKKDLTLEDLKAVFFGEEVIIKLTDSAKAAIEKSANYINEIIKTDKVIYGVNTGFGKLAKVLISKENLAQLQTNIVLSHAVGTGDLLDSAVVKLMLLLKVNSLARGYSGIQPGTIEFLIQLFNQNLIPCVPGKGSVGASGDLAPLAHMVLPVLLEGDIEYKGVISSSKEALQKAGIAPTPLAPKEGLALLNGTQASTALAVAGLFQLENIFQAAVLAGSLSTIAIGGQISSFDPILHKVRNQPCQVQIAAQYEYYLSNSEYEMDMERVQTPYSIRCQPQVMGACLQQLQNAKTILENEANGVSDNPLIFADEDKVISGGNFHAEPIAMAADNLALSIAETANISERRVALLVDPSISGLPAFLVNEAGINSGFMMAQATAAALVSENKTFAHPASVDSIPTSANQEDHVSMATFAARRLTDMAQNSATVIAIELLAACQALDLISSWTLCSELKSCYDLVRQHSKFYDKDRYMAHEINAVRDLILAGIFTSGNYMRSPDYSG
jgi:histidine ammonia-lyase